MNKNSTESVNNKYPKLTPESIVRQDLQILSRRPDGHNFKAIKILKDKFDTEDKYLIFEFNDGSYVTWSRTIFY